MSQAKLFDLNIERVLEHWDAFYAVREIIANALDEQNLTNTRDISIFKAGMSWHIRDYGRGLEYLHFTQNENKEKLENPNLIGKFGVGLKDALAVFYRKGYRVEIFSRHATISLVMSSKSSFDIQTLHAKFEEAIDNSMEGTEFVIYNLEDDIMSKAKDMFLCFNKRIKLLETTPYGEILQGDDTPKVYINGAQVAIEENFLFSYNITNISAKIKKALNRERSNVGRAAYSDSVKNILCQSKSESVLYLLANELHKISLGEHKDELEWVDVASHATKRLESDKNTVFVTATQISVMSNQDREILQESGKIITVIPDKVFGKVSESVTTINTITQEYQDSFHYEYVDYSVLSFSEKRVFDLRLTVISFLKRHSFIYDIPIKISESICPDSLGKETYGVFTDGCIIIKRNVLNSESMFLGVLIHEFAHAQHNYHDNSRDFENDLTNFLGFAMLDLEQ